MDKNVDETFCKPENKRKVKQSENLAKLAPKTTHMALQYFTQDNFTSGTSRNYFINSTQFPTELHLCVHTKYKQHKPANERKS